VERPAKRRKEEVVKKALVDIESEDDEPLEEVPLKRVLERLDDIAPVKKKRKGEPKTTKHKKARSKKNVIEQMDLDLEALDVLGFESSLSPAPSPKFVRKPPVRIRTPSPPLDPLEEGICDDDEDMYFTKIALSQADLTTPEPSPVLPSEPTPLRKHVTGSARTEGYYKISHAEKSAYVAQYALRSTAIEQTIQVDAAQPQTVTSSRSNRANARRQAQGLEEIHQVQRAVALSKGETNAAELSFKFNQLQTRKKHLRFARSPIHDWGLYAMERISRGEMVIEYVGEIIRAQVADKREKAYERQGIGSSYLFRIDDDLVVDATKKGNLGCVEDMRSCFNSLQLLNSMMQTFN
jgi:hypothetical protein